jgi:hypothetical protein
MQEGDCHQKRKVKELSKRAELKRPVPTATEKRE